MKQPINSRPFLYAALGFCFTTVAESPREIYEQSSQARRSQFENQEAERRQRYAQQDQAHRQNLANLTQQRDEALNQIRSEISSLRSQSQNALQNQRERHRIEREQENREQTELEVRHRNEASNASVNRQNALNAAATLPSSARFSAESRAKSAYDSVISRNRSEEFAQKRSRETSASRRSAEVYAEESGYKRKIEQAQSKLSSDEFAWNRKIENAKSSHDSARSSSDFVAQRGRSALESQIASEAYSVNRAQQSWEKNRPPASVNYPPKLATKAPAPAPPLATDSPSSGVYEEGPVEPDDLDEQGYPKYSHYYGSRPAPGHEDTEPVPPITESGQRLSAVGLVDGRSIAIPKWANWMWYENENIFVSTVHPREVEERRKILTSGPAETLAQVRSEFTARKEALTQRAVREAQRIEREHEAFKLWFAEQLTKVPPGTLPPESYTHVSDELSKEFFEQGTRTRRLSEPYVTKLDGLAAQMSDSNFIYDRKKHGKLLSGDLRRAIRESFAEVERQRDVVVREAEAALEREQNHPYPFTARKRAEKFFSLVSEVALGLAQAEKVAGGWKAEQEGRLFKARARLDADLLYRLVTSAQIATEREVSLEGSALAATLAQHHRAAYARWESVLATQTAGVEKAVAGLRESLQRAAENLTLSLSPDANLPLDGWSRWEQTRQRKLDELDVLTRAWDREFEELNLNGDHRAEVALEVEHIFDRDQAFTSLKAAWAKEDAELKSSPAEAFWTKEIEAAVQRTHGLPETRDVSHDLIEAVKGVEALAGHITREDQNFGLIYRVTPGGWMESSQFPRHVAAIAYFAAASEEPVYLVDFDAAEGDAAERVDKEAFAARMNEVQKYPGSQLRVSYFGKEWVDIWVGFGELLNRALSPSSN